MFVRSRITAIASSLAWLVLLNLQYGLDVSCGTPEDGSPDFANASPDSTPEWGIVGRKQVHSKHPASGNAAIVGGAVTIHIAAKTGDLKQVNRLVTESNMDICDSEGNTPLYYAVRNKHERIIEFLKRQGADINKVLIRFVAGRATTDEVDFVLQKGANVNSVNKRGFTPIYFAARSANQEMVKHLLSKGADVLKPLGGNKTVFDSVDEFYHTGAPHLHYDEWNSLEDIRKMLIGRAFIEQVEIADAKQVLKEDKILKDAQVALQSAIEEEKTQGAVQSAIDSPETHKPGPFVDISEEVKRLFESGKIDEAVEKHAHSKSDMVIKRILANGQIAKIEKWLKLGANINALDHQGRSGLFYAVMGGKYPLVDFLLQKNVRVDGVLDRLRKERRKSDGALGASDGVLDAMKARLETQMDKGFMGSLRRRWSI
jgi:ankyrin repeat protein